MADSPPPSPPIIAGDEIDLVAFFGFLRRFVERAFQQRRLLVRFTIGGALFGVLWALGSPEEFSSTIKLLPYSPQSPTSGLAAGLSGVLGLRSSGGMFDRTLSAYTYPDVVASIDYRLALADRPIRFGDPDTTVTPYEYFTRIWTPSMTELFARYTIKLPKTAKSWLSSLLSPAPTEAPVAGMEDELIRLTVVRRDIADALKARTTINVDDVTGIVSIQTLMPDRVAAASLANESARLLMERAIALESRKAAEELAFVDARLTEASARLATARATLTRFLESNRDLTSARLSMRRQELEEQIVVQAQVVQQLTAQQNESEIKKARDTPVFTVLQHATVPIERTSPNRSLVVLLFSLLGLILGLWRTIGRSVISAPAS